MEAWLCLMTGLPHLNKQQTKGNLTKIRITEVARALFFEFGYDATSTAQIAKNVGLSEAALYKHFKGKKTLLLATVVPERLLTKKESYYMALSEKELLDEWTAYLIAVVFANRPQYTILYNESQKHPELSEDYLRYIHKKSIIDCEVLKRINDGALPKIDLVLLQVGLIGALLAMLKHKEIHDSGLNLSAVPEDIKHMLFLMVEGKHLDQQL